MLSLICGDLRLICGDLQFSGRPRGFSPFCNILTFVYVINNVFADLNGLNGQRRHIYHIISSFFKIGRNNDKINKHINWLFREKNFREKNFHKSVITYNEAIHTASRVYSRFTMPTHTAEEGTHIRSFKTFIFTE